jgi:uncharacterized repeat protein (TIGR03833 family)
MSRSRFERDLLFFDFGSIILGKFSMDGQTRSNIKPGMSVLIVLKQDQRTGKLTKGIVRDILTKSPTHPHGIKVRLESGAVGRVQQIIDDKETS